MPSGRWQIARASDGTELHFQTYGDAGRPAVFLGPHFYPSSPEADELCTDRWIEVLERDFYLILADYPRGIGRTGRPQRRGYTPDIAVEEYECIATAAGVQRFGWLGYSFGGAMGIQLACRSTRLSALVVGGFPPLDAPYRELLELSRTIAQTPPPFPAHVGAGVLWSAVGFYQSLLAWDERSELARLRLPRLVFMGDEDEGQGNAAAAQRLPLAERLRGSEAELRALGWHVVWLAGRDHVSAVGAEQTISAVLEFFRAELLHVR